jgi:hypothetical protein
MIQNNHEQTLFVIRCKNNTKYDFCYEKQNKRTFLSIYSFGKIIKYIEIFFSFHIFYVKTLFQTYFDDTLNISDIDIHHVDILLQQFSFRQTLINDILFNASTRKLQLRDHTYYEILHSLDPLQTVFFKKHKFYFNKGQFDKNNFLKILSKIKTAILLQNNYYGTEKLDSDPEHVTHLRRIFYKFMNENHLHITDIDLFKSICNN